MKARTIKAICLISLFALGYGIRGHMSGSIEPGWPEFYGFTVWVGVFGLFVTVLLLALRLAMKHGRGG